MNREQIGYMKRLSHKLEQTNKRLTENLEKIAILIDNDKVDEYIRLIKENDGLILEMGNIREELMRMEPHDNSEKESMLTNIELLAENLRNLNQTNIDKLTKSLGQKTEENMMRSKKVHASRVYNDMQLDE